VNRSVRPALLVLADGSTFEGEAIGAPPAGHPAGPGVASGEVVFNTVLSGYQEVITDPSYAGQIITFTYPHIGNVGVNAVDFESRAAFCRGVVVRELARRRSNQRAEGDLDALLVLAGIPGIAGVDTRRLTRLLRDTGAMPGAFGTADETVLRAAAQAEPGTDGVDLVSTVTTARPYRVGVERPGGLRIVAFDFGIKRMILRHLAGLGVVEVVPAGTTADEVLALRPDGVFLSNGPGDPAVLTGVVPVVEELLGEVPLFGICLGHQLLGRALGASTVKLPFGHHGGNHPVQHLRSGRIEITSQNHNFAIDDATLPHDAFVTHRNLNDGVCEGVMAPALRAFGVQHHPEAGPGPHDSRYLFAQFADAMRDPDAFFASGGAAVIAHHDETEGHEVAGLPVPEVQL
jgi:carbamoyl-phosphate synthase small subunit